jgi:hypothetical protein
MFEMLMMLLLSLISDISSSSFGLKKSGLDIRYRCKLNKWTPQRSTV